MNTSKEQFNALHVWCDWCAAELNKRKIFMDDFLKEGIEIPWTKELVNDYLWPDNCEEGVEALRLFVRDNYGVPLTSNTKTKIISEAAKKLNESSVGFRQVIRGKKTPWTKIRFKNSCFKYVLMRRKNIPSTKLMTAVDCLDTQTILCAALSERAITPPPWPVDKKKAEKHGVYVEWPHAI